MTFLRSAQPWELGAVGSPALDAGFRRGAYAKT